MSESSIVNYYHTVNERAIEWLRQAELSKFNWKIDDILRHHTHTHHFVPFSTHSHPFLIHFSQLNWIIEYFKSLILRSASIFYRFSNILFIRKANESFFAVYRRVKEERWREKKFFDCLPEMVLMANQTNFTVLWYFQIISWPNQKKERNFCLFTIVSYTNFYFIFILFFFSQLYAMYILCKCCGCKRNFFFLFLLYCVCVRLR